MNNQERALALIKASNQTTPPFAMLAATQALTHAVLHLADVMAPAQQEEEGEPLPVPGTSVFSGTKVVHHNHVTRVVKPRGECPACDRLQRPSRDQDETEGE